MKLVSVALRWMAVCLPMQMALAADSVPAPAAASANRVSVLTAEQVIQILDETVDWYRTLGTQQQNANQPSDLLILYANRQTADEVIGFAFEIARANAELLSSEVGADNAAAAGSAPQALNQQQDQLDEKRRQLEQQVDTDKHRLAAGGKGKSGIQDQVFARQSEIAMVDARKNLLETTADFVNENDAKMASANALKAQIDAIAATVPTSSANPVPASTVPAPAAAAAQGAAGASSIRDTDKPPPARLGLWDLASNAMKLRAKIETIGVIDRHTAALAATFQDISALPRRQLLAYSSRSEALAPLADKASGAALKDLRGQFDTLAWLFKQTSDILIPLTKEQVLLQQYRHNLANWKDATARQYDEALTVLAFRLGILVGMLAAIFGLAEVWRRIVRRFVIDARRRYQLLLIRKIVLWTLVAAVVSLNIVTEISSFMTFAGLITAGVAVAMQSVLVSVVGYFFLIGKYGIRVGDRVQVGTVVGDVIHLGLVRMHLMELNPTGPLGPTGRVVAFANLIVFQATGGLFKQIPGVNLSWHETTLVLPVVGDYSALKDRLLTAVSGVVEAYRGEFVRQSEAIEQTTAANAVKDSVPQVQMHLASGRMEALIRYPVSLKHAIEIDELVSEAVLKIIGECAAAAPP